MRSILFAGGGTLGPVTPLLAVADRLRESDADMEFLWVGTDDGPERELIESKGIPFYTLPEAKFPRYLSRKLMTAPIDFMRARRASRRILAEYHPRVIVSAGGFTAVPLVQEAFYRNIPCISHQLDAIPGLSNRLIARQSRYVTLSYGYDSPPFKTRGTMYRIPTPVRFKMNEVPSREEACRIFDLDPAKKVLLIVGGGTGAITLNLTMTRIIKRLPEDLQVIHVSGKGKEIVEEEIDDGPTIRRYSFLSEEMFDALAIADLVVSRAGIGAISELAMLSKPTIFVPLPDSPQIQNLVQLGEGIVHVDQSSDVFEQDLFELLMRYLSSDSARMEIGSFLHEAFPTDDGETLAHLVRSTLV